MQITLDTNVAAFLDRLSFVGRVTGRKGSQYELALIEANELGLFLRSFNGFAHAVARLSEDTGDAVMLCQLKPLAGALGAVDGPCTITFDFAKTEVRVRGPLKLNHRCMTAENFADFPKEMSGGTLLDDPGAVADAIRRVSIPIDPSSPHSRFRGLFMQVNGEMTLAATNGTAVTESVLAAKFPEHAEALIPYESLDALRYVIDAGGARVKVADRVLVAGSAKASIALVTALLAEKFVNYRAILVDPSSAESVVVEKKKLLQAARVCGGYADEFTAVYLIVRGGEVEMRSIGTERGKASLSMAHTGDDVDVVLKASANRIREVVEPLDAAHIELLIPVEQEPTRIGFRPFEDDTAVSVLSLMRMDEGEYESLA